MTVTHPLVVASAECGRCDRAERLVGNVDVARDSVAVFPIPTMIYVAEHLTGITTEIMSPRGVEHWPMIYGPGRHIFPADSIAFRRHPALHVVEVNHRQR